MILKGIKNNLFQEHIYDNCDINLEEQYISIKVKQ